ncbi:NeuD/PglB/VioB family sugar acetyltransferase [Escherichia coli]|uniref:NeuD/PglB/VioB family sugar acetyltransferase n=1 Tax=Escherichia coli TaxID=562 RepID=UPI00092DBB7E|nr:NeuD/PglB/VioB family sugar acetyltransferase [Escherichia coli]APK18112.1 acetyltransferase [Escherichia coli]APK41381.1 acetyltransferase [Escherichia coli]
MDIYGIVGAGGFGREVAPLVQFMFDELPFHDSYKLVYIVENSESKQISGIDVLSPQEFCESDYDNKFFNVAIGDSKVRERIASMLMAAGAVPFTIKGHHSIQYESSDIHDSAILCPFTCVTADAKIGKFFHANIYSYVAHDCIIGDYVTFAPGVKCNGSVVIGDHVYVGAGAVIKQGSPKRPIIIGDGAVIGMGAVVTKSVPAGVTVFGNPAKPLTKKGMAS